MARNIFAVISLTTIGGAVFVAGGLSLWGAWRTASWPTVLGTITLSSLTTKTGDDGSTTYRPTVEYEYVVAGRAFRGTRIQSGPSWSSSSASRAQSLADRYPVQSQHMVAYDPQDPSHAVLKAGVPWILYVVVLLGAFFLWLGLASWRD